MKTTNVALRQRYAWARVRPAKSVGVELMVVQSNRFDYDTQPW
jgi:hypothetical protein